MSNAFFDWGRLTQLYTGDAQTPLERWLVRITRGALSVFSVGFVIYFLTRAARYNFDPHAPLWARLLSDVMTVTLWAGLLSFIAAGLLIVGHKAGRSKPSSQARYTFGRLALFFLLPIFILTVAIMLFAWLAGAYNP